MCIYIYILMKTYAKGSHRSPYGRHYEYCKKFDNPSIEEIYNSKKLKQRTPIKHIKLRFRGMWVSDPGTAPIGFA